MRDNQTIPGVEKTEQPTYLVLTKSTQDLDGHPSSLHTPLPQVLSICAMLSCGNSVFYRPKDHAVHADNARLNFARGGGGDHGTLMRVYNQWVDTNYSTQVGVD